MHTRPLIGITMGDPVGIGPEIITRALDRSDVYDWCRPLVIGDMAVLEAAARVTGTRATIRQITTPDAGDYQPKQIDVLSPPGPPLSETITWGQPTPETGQKMEACITTAIDLALSGDVAAMVTAPINKAAMKLGGSRFTGHTELLAERTKTSRYAMMMAGDRLRVVLVTIHIPIKEVPQTLTEEAIVETIAITAESLSDRFGLAAPKIAVAGLNPHAGEEGLFGDEENRLIAPAVETAQKSIGEKTGATTGATIDGPLPPDTVFYQAAAGRFDAVVCMYHDQGLIPFKMIHFSDGVNTTLGLPIIRTSVDHGTAYDIAGTGRADSNSLRVAIKMAADQARREKTDRLES